VNRRFAYPGAADQYYTMPYYLPAGNQQSNGLLDVYRNRVKFGLMSMDPVYGLESFGSGAYYYLNVPTYWGRLSQVTGALGEYSYGPPRPVSWPGCVTAYVSNGGARRAPRGTEVIPGGLISVGKDSADHLITNSQVQSSLLSIRPYGGSPIDAMLMDLAEWAENDEDIAVGSDPLSACRSRFAILISDGEGDTFYRRIGCETPGSVCPYPREVEMVRQLCQFDGDRCRGLLDGIYAVGYSVSSAEGLANMNQIAVAGGTRTSYTADDALGLIASLSRVLDRAATGTTTRTTPAYAKSETTFSPTSSDPGQQYEFTSGFRVGNSTTPWTGVLERARYVCTDSSLPAAKSTPSLGDSFHGVLNSRNLTASPRSLITAPVTSIVSARGIITSTIPADMRLPLSTTRGTTRTSVMSQVAVELIAPEVFGFGAGSSSTRIASRTTLMSWLRGESRPGARLGDIYHSSPVVVTPPRTDIPDESYNLFRRRPDVSSRPIVLYVGTNDGILHAFAAESHTLPSGRVLGSGEELWGFVPPAVLPSLQTASVSHQFLVDGTPVVKEVYLRRLPGGTPSADIYRTVLIAGLRGGGPHYFALDVSDPTLPRFMWQFTRPEMGPTVGRPAMAQVLVRIDGVLQERAVAILGGGGGELALTGGTGRGWGACSIPPGAARSKTVLTAPGRAGRRCWLGNQGRGLYVVDIASGEVIREFVGGDLISPMTGGISPFTGDVGTIATRAYTTDADGVLWRLDLSSTNSAQWSLEAVHDLYWADTALDGADSQDPPVLSTDQYGNVVALVGTGNVDDLEGTDLYRVASVTDEFTVGSAGVAVWSPRVNWEIRLQPGEQVVGPMELFDSRLYFSTFSSTSNPRNMCEWGGGKLWGVDYLASGAGPAGYTTVGLPSPGPGMTSSSGALTHFSPTASNTIAVGVSIRQAPTCASGLTEIDPYSGGGRWRTTSVGGGQFTLVSQASGSNASRSASSSIEVISVGLPMPNSFTSIQSISRMD
jgi:type IV pilus assembly protein PilY1